MTTWVIGSENQRVADFSMFQYTQKTNTVWKICNHVAPRLFLVSPSVHFAWFASRASCERLEEGTWSQPWAVAKALCAWTCSWETCTSETARRIFFSFSADSARDSSRDDSAADLSSLAQRCGRQHLGAIFTWPRQSCRRRWHFWITREQAIR